MTSNDSTPRETTSRASTTSRESNAGAGDQGQNHGMSYRDAGVDIDAGNQLIEAIKPDIKRTLRPGVLGGIGGFGGLFELPANDYDQPVLVSGADGVGTKLMLANLLDDHAGIGTDLVAMCVNDIIVCGAEPLFFLDYYACGKLDVQKSRQIIAGIADGCVQAGAALIGGETAEMPGMYDSDDYDLAGFAVGIVEKKKILDKSSVKAGDCIIGLSSSGFHSNGYSLIRKVITASGADIHATLGDNQSDQGRASIAKSLMQPTRIYVKSLLRLLDEVTVNALAHITGGGLTENIPRSLPNNTMAAIDNSSWQRPEIFNWLQTNGNIAEDEMLRTFNCGVGMVAIVPASEQQAALDSLKASGEQAIVIGEVTDNKNSEATVHWT